MANRKKRVLVRDVYAQVCVIEERLSNHINEARRDFKDFSVRLSNLEDRFTYLKDNELEHLKHYKLNRKEKAAIIIGVLGFAAQAVQALLFLKQTFG